MSRALSRRACVRGLVAGALLPAALGGPAAASELRVARQDVAGLADIPLQTMQRRSTRLLREIDGAEPLWLNFVFTTCSSTCSMQTAVLAALQTRLARERLPVRLLSLSIDPEADTPEQLAEFAARFGVQPANWQFCTGRFDDLLQPQKAFDVYRGAKAAHPPVVLLRTSRQAPWWRISGYPTPEDLHRLLAQKLALERT